MSVVNSSRVSEQGMPLREPANQLYPPVRYDKAVAKRSEPGHYGVLKTEYVGEYTPKKGEKERPCDENSPLRRTLEKKGRTEQDFLTTHKKDYVAKKLQETKPFTRPERTSSKSPFRSDTEYQSLTRRANEPIPKKLQSTSQPRERQAEFKGTTVYQADYKGRSPRASEREKGNQFASSNMFKTLKPMDGRTIYNTDFKSKPTEARLPVDSDRFRYSQWNVKIASKLPNTTYQTHYIESIKHLSNTKAF